MSEDKNISKFGDELKKNPFSVPKGYFDQLPSRIQEKCTVPDESKKSWVKVLIPQLGFVLGFVVLVLLAKGFFKLVGHIPESTGSNVALLADTSILDSKGNNKTIDDESLVIDDVIISYLIDNNVSDLDIIQ